MLKSEENGVFLGLAGVLGGDRGLLGMGWPATCSSHPVRENGKTLPCLRATLDRDRAIPVFRVGGGVVVVRGDCRDLFLGDPDGSCLRSGRRSPVSALDDRASRGPARPAAPESPAHHGPPGRADGARNVPDVHSPFVSVRIGSKRKLRKASRTRSNWLVRIPARISMPPGRTLAASRFL